MRVSYSVYLDNCIVKNSARIEEGISGIKLTATAAQGGG